ncbi:putative phosphatase [Fulvia fulva]|uniref:Phosphatase n=1 Tax=Passalora fulva TaxID=5499 RepID=A0A9Q8P8A2_PASFU|nr:putative phosphatase [Fulvia fulva]UJO16903.1 putative phosphatase [Fulvia fulva]
MAPTLRSSQAKMPPTLILIRHAEAEHNATENWDLPDPRLTEAGIQQCEDLQRHLQSSCPLAQRVETIITSPMRRTCQTTLTALAWLVKSGIPVEVNAMWQENSTEPCDSGTAIPKVAKEFPELDFSTVDPTYPNKGPGTPYAFAESANAARGQACLRSLYDRPEKVIAVVSHAGFLRTAITKRRYANADYRIFTFKKSNGGALELVEDLSTMRKGGGLGRSPKGIFKVKEWDFPPEEAEAGEERDEM